MARIARLYVVIVPALLFTGILDYLHGAWDGTRDGPSSFLINLFFLQGIYGGAYGSNGPLWSLSYEWWFYILFGLSLTAVALSVDFDFCPFGIFRMPVHVDSGTAVSGHIVDVSFVAAGRGRQASSGSSVSEDVDHPAFIGRAVRSSGHIERSLGLEGRFRRGNCGSRTRIFRQRPQAATLFLVFHWGQSSPLFHSAYTRSTIRSIIS